MAIYAGGQVRLLPLDPHSALPEVVKTILYITRDHKYFVGQEAIELYYHHNVNRLRRFVKKRAGEIEFRGAELYYVRDVYVYVDELKPGRLMQYLKTALRKSSEADRFAGTLVFDRYYPIADLIQVYLRALKERAEAIVGEEISSITLGRPVKFSDLAELDRLAEETLRQAALQAGYQQVSFELEPVAAALYYGKNLDHPQNVLIFDFGGGTLDIAILRLGDPLRREVFASGGIDIAGSDFDREIIEKRMLPYFGLGQVYHIPEILELIHAVPDWIALPELSTPQNRQLLEKAIRDGIAPARLNALKALIFNDLAFSFYNQVEMAKIALSSQAAATIELPSPGIDLWELYTRSSFERDIQFHSTKIEQVLLNTLADSGLEPGQIDAVVKTGGSANIPLFTDMLGRIFGPERVLVTNPFSSVSAGLAIRAAEG
jgi:hypothetical chaperone protein